MLEIRNITKIYRSKAGNEVKALDNVSITFPETGMVFVLGKSGSGKSTLLNVIGGLDGCDDGEFVIKGKSSKDFAGSDFDAYRNTFIGFIFQEYNILDDFSVGANIALALELQGKKATNEQINGILGQVELLDYAKRKPNELSGGQKQRIAIARALVKDPEIIMADEPTGALDSNTGKQIFDTLKELSKTKLVIIVSHDRDFAERYADRIIEMKDGQIESDVTKHEVAAKEMSAGILQVSDNLLRIEKGYQLTAKDVELINKYLSSRDSDVLLSGDKRLNDSVRNVAGISADNTSKVFDPTDEKKDVKVKTYDGRQTKFIRSSLPMKNAVKMGGNSLGHKKFRLVMTIFLSLIAFALFGFADTMGSYDKVTATTNSIVDTGIKNASFSLGLKYSAYSEGKLQYEGQNSASFNNEDISALSQKLGINFIPVFNGSSNVGRAISLTGNMKVQTYIDSTTAYSGQLHGFSSIDEAKLSSLGFTYVGNLPANDLEVAISKLIYEQFKANGFKNNSTNEEVSAENLTMDPTGANSIIGKHITVRVGNGDYTLKITAVIDTQFDYTRYASFIPDTTSANNNQQGSGEESGLLDMVMAKELQSTLHYGFHCIGYVTEGTVTAMSRNMEKWYSESAYLGESIYNLSPSLRNPADEGDSDGHFGNKIGLNRVGNSSLISKVGTIQWVNGTPKTTLEATDILVSARVLNSLLESDSVDITDKVNQAIAETLAELGSTPQPEGTIDSLTGPAFEKYVKEAMQNANIVAALKVKYPEHNGGTPYDPTADQDGYMLEHLFRRLTGDDSTEIDGGLTRNEAAGKYGYKPFLEKVLGIDFDTKYTTLKYDELNNVRYNISWNGEEHDRTYALSAGNLRYILVELYVANIFGDSVKAQEIINDPRFASNVINNGEYSIDVFTDPETTYDIKLDMAIRAYCDMLNNQSTNASYGDKTYYDFATEANNMFATLSGKTLSDYANSVVLYTSKWDHKTGNNTDKQHTEYKIVGFFEHKESTQDLIISDGFYNVWAEYRDAEGFYYYEYTPHEDGIYAFVIAPMPTDIAKVRELVELTYTDENGIIFKLENQVMNSLEFFNEFIEMGASIFVYVGLGFAFFAALMMMNFISTSISYKRREIGILRAVGARSSDVFKIFFSEALIIALINYVLSTIATVVAIVFLNTAVRNEGINVTLLNFGIRQIILMLAVSVLVAAISSFLPVWNIARRKPVDAIKNK